MKQSTFLNRAHVLLLVQRIVTLLLGASMAGVIALWFFHQGRGWLRGLLYAILVLGVVVLIWINLRVQRTLKRTDATLEAAMSLGGTLLVDGAGQETGDQGDRIDPVLLEHIRDVFKEFLNLGSTQEIIRNQTNLVALQNQINPHFLYNTLDVIRSEAIIEGAVNASDMIETLSRIFRYGISIREDLVTVAAELKNVQDYFRIQQYRFMDRYVLRIENPEQIHGEEILIPKLTLQPLVENAILHAFHHQSTPGTVTIRLEQSGTMLKIIVSDDGSGMDQETLCALRDRIRSEAQGVYQRLEKDTTGIALENINKRIKLFFGGDYGLYVYSLPRAGTDIVVTLPAGQGGG